MVIGILHVIKLTFISVDGIIIDDLVEQNELVPMQRQGKEEDGDQLNHGEQSHSVSQYVEKYDSLS